MLAHLKRAQSEIEDIEKTKGGKLRNLLECTFLTISFLDALASLDSKLSVSQSVIDVFQLAHLRVFQLFNERDLSEGILQCLSITEGLVWWDS